MKVNHIWFLLLLPCTLIWAKDENPVVRIQTTQGDITVELDYANAPISVVNFLNYAKSGFYDGTIFHRVIPDFMVQGGGFTETYEKKETQAPIKNEAENGVKNFRGSVAMARGVNPDSATSQFFFNVKDNVSLDFKGTSSQDFGYAVFGKTINGLEVIDKIQKMPVGEGGPFKKYLPQTPVLLTKVIIEKDLAATAANSSMTEEPPPAAVAMDGGSEAAPTTTVTTNDAPPIAASAVAPAIPASVPLDTPEPPDQPAVE